MTEFVKPEPKEKPAPIDNTELVRGFRAMGGQIFHIRPNSRRRGITFAFVVKGSRVEVATAVQHRADMFTKKIGTKTAIKHFAETKTIFLPINKDTHLVSAFETLAIYL